MTDDEKKQYEAEENAKSLTWAIIKGKIKIATTPISKFTGPLFMISFVVLNFKEEFRPSVTMLHKMTLAFLWITLLKQSLGMYLAAKNESGSLYRYLQKTGALGTMLLVSIAIYAVIIYLSP